MTERDDADAVRAAAQVIDALTGRLHDVLPALRGVTEEVRDAWWDDRGREWTERASLLRRSLERDLDAALAAGRAALTMLESLAVPADAGGSVPAVPAVRTGTRGGGPRLPGTDADRVEDPDGMRLGTLDG